MPKPESRRALARLGPVALGLALFVILWIVFRRFTVDDAFIAYRHAHNFARGLGPVMNPGERVEGVSNLPWTLLLGVLSAAGIPPHLAGPVLSLLAGLACIPLAARLAAGMTGDRIPGGVAAVVCGAGVPLAIWSASGMETPAYAVALLALLHAALSKRGGAPPAFTIGAGLGLVAAMRPEGCIFIVPLAWWTWHSGARPRQRLGRMLLGTALLLVPLLLFRRFYYGDWVPNPVHAKAPDGFAALGPGTLYVLKLLVSFPLAFAACWHTWRTHETAPGARLVGACVVTQLVFALLVGGDFFAGYRFVAPVWPILAVLVAIQLHGATATARTTASPSGASRRRAIALVVVATGVGILLLIGPEILLPAAGLVARLGRLHLPPEAHTLRLLAELRHLGVVLVALVAWWLAWPRLRSGFALRRATALWIACTLVPVAFDPQVRDCRQADAASRYGRPVGEWLRANVPPGTLVATNSAGSLPYWSDLPVLDMLGLTNRHIGAGRADPRQWVGHERGDGLYVLARRPGILIFGGPEGSLDPWPFPGDREIAADFRFQRDYKQERVRLADFEFQFYRWRDLQLGGGAAPHGL